MIWQMQRLWLREITKLFSLAKIKVCWQLIVSNLVILQLNKNNNFYIKGKFYKLSSYFFRLHVYKNILTYVPWIIERIKSSSPNMFPLWDAVQRYTSKYETRFVLKEQLKFYGNFYPYLATEKREKQLRIIKKHWPFRES